MHAPNERKQLPDCNHPAMPQLKFDQREGKRNTRESAVASSSQVFARTLVATATPPAAGQDLKCMVYKNTV